MFALEAGLLGHGLLPAIDREIIIARVTARTGCAYEWGAHAATLAQQAGLSQEQLQATTDVDAAANTAWLPRHAALLNAVDERTAWAGHRSRLHPGRDVW
ncbi:carboxymuconolactone decarboxylase family protein [Streptomyces sp. NPDC005574]|uniref:carboxymuconolactone decarboxylase family protein n=1 Tax=Streptomyces sp. NPDC005574 TaxID=3156891 RepID=UPI0033A59A85